MRGRIVRVRKGGYNGKKMRAVPMGAAKEEGTYGRVQREEGVDVLKGAAVCCMVFAHTVRCCRPRDAARVCLLF